MHNRFQLASLVVLIIILSFLLYSLKCSLSSCPLVRIARVWFFCISFLLSGTWLSVLQSHLSTKKAGFMTSTKIALGNAGVACLAKEFINCFSFSSSFYGDRLCFVLWRNSYNLYRSYFFHAGLISGDSFSGELGRASDVNSKVM